MLRLKLHDQPGGPALISEWLAWGVADSSASLAKWLHIGKHCMVRRCDCGLCCPSASWASATVFGKLSSKRKPEQHQAGRRPTLQGAGFLITPPWQAWAGTKSSSLAHLTETYPN